MFKEIVRKLILVLAIFSCLVFVHLNSEKVEAESTSKYLVLVQKKDGTWKEYKDLVEISSSGNIMIKAKPLSKALGFTYQKHNNGSFAIKNSSTRYNIYTRDNEDFLYSSDYLYSKILASNVAYTSKESKYNLCHVGSLRTLVNYKFFNSIDAEEYPDYKGVICYSKYNEIPVSVPASTPKPTKEPTPTPKPEPTTISIEGIDFPVRDSFLTLKKVGSDWGGANISWYELEKEVDSKFLDSTDLNIGIDKIEFSHIGAGSDGVYLTKTSSGYKITISVKLSGSVISNQNAAIVKAMLVTISSKPSLVYTAIYESFTTSETHGIKEDKYVTIGDCKIKIKIKDGEVIYYIKKA